MRSSVRLGRQTRAIRVPRRRQRTAIADVVQMPAVGPRMKTRSTVRESESGRAASLERLIPALWVLQHDLAQQPHRRRAVAQALVVEALEREALALLLAVVVAELEELELADRVEAVARVIRPALGLGAGGGLLVVAVVHEEARGLVDAHALRVHLDRCDHAAEAQERLVRLREPVLGRDELALVEAEAFVDGHLLAVVGPAFA